MKFEHVKRGSWYTLEDIVNAACDLEEGEDLIIFSEDDDAGYYEVQGTIKEGELVVLYYDVEYYCWARPASEFFDGRFKRV